MKKIIKKIIVKVLGIRFYNLIIPLVSSTNHYIKQFLYSLITLSIKIKILIILKLQPLILITQVNGGGTLISQLLDNHKELHAFPSELILTDPKWDWTKKKTLFHTNQWK